MTSLAEIGIHRSERALLLGGTGSGKSTLGEHMIANFVAEFPRGRVLVLDSKPRFRAEWLPDGTSARRKYRRWSHGSVTPGSMAVDLFGRPSQALATAWQMGCRIAIAQTDTARLRPNLLALLEAFFKDARASRPQLVFVDETLDFFHSNGSPIAGNDSILRVARAGRELGVSGAFSSQRGKGIPIQLRSELSQAYIFKLDHVLDIQETYQFGFPRNVAPPSEDHLFWYWHKKTQREPRLCRLDLSAA